VLHGSAADLIMLYLAVETTSIPLYILAGFLTRDDKSTNRVLYLLFGAMTSSVMLYGFSLLYGFAWQPTLCHGADYHVRTGAISAIVWSPAFDYGGLWLQDFAVRCTFGRRTPMRCADTHCRFLSTASKAAGFAVLLRVLISAFPTDVTPGRL
jgi:NADH-quinone oxidoreductase subunit N